MEKQPEKLRTLEIALGMH